MDENGMMSETDCSTYQQVEQELVALLETTWSDSGKLTEKIEELEARLGDTVYSEALYLLSHLHFDPEEARAHWERILEHRQSLSGKLGCDVDFRVALLDYFISVSQHFTNPKIIEIKIFQKTQDSAIRDALTGLHNYRYFRSELEQELRRARRSGEPVSLAIFDVDYFKWYNDRNGHLEGDRALRAVADLIQSHARASDVVARYGGEEFAVLFVGSDKPRALEAAERIRVAVAKHPFRFAKQQPHGRFSVSGGLAGYLTDALDPTGLLDAADHALYAAKGQGRDRVLSASDENRRFQRIPAVLAGSLQRLSGRSHAFMTTDLSAQGVQFVCSEDVDTGDFFRFVLMLPTSGREIEGVARATRVAGTEDGRYRVGAKIVEISWVHADALRDYVDAWQAASEAESSEEPATAGDSVA